LKKWNRRPSPAFVVAVLALSVAVVGTAVAGPAVISRLDGNEKRQVKKISKKQANKQIKKKAGGLSVGHAVSATGPDAYAKVSETGVLDSAFSKGVGSVTRQGEGEYCLTGVAFTPKGGQVTTDFNESNDYVIAQLRIPGDSGNTAACPPGTQVKVETGLPGDTPSDSGFFVSLYQ
jgi:hypothetical protein